MLSVAILRYLTRAVGAAQADAARVAAGERRGMSELMERGAWSSLATTQALAEVAAGLTGDGQVGRRAGEELFRIIGEIGRTDLLVAAGSVEKALEFVVATSSQVVVGLTMTIVDRTDGSLTVETTYRDGVLRGEFLCDFAAGYWASVPSLFGSSGYTTHTRCQARGDDRCSTSVSWVESEGSSVDSTSAAERADEMFFRYEEIQQIAADVITASDVPALLDLVVQRAGHAVLAPRFVLAVDLQDGSGHRVHHLGFADDESARRAVGRVAKQGSSPSVLAVAVASGRTDYGVLAAFYEEGVAATALDGRLMAAYGAHVAAALEAMASSDEARRDRDTARALLELSRRLAGATSVEDVAQRVADALHGIADGCHATVHLWQPTLRRLHLAAVDIHADRGRLPDDLDVDAIDGLATILDAADATVDLGDVLRRDGAEHVVSCPVVARGELLGVVSASFDHAVGAADRALLIDRLSGVADQAAIAFDNARLIEQARHQATHDGLTGLPNRPMLEDRANQALAASRRDGRQTGVLFIDLDRFKKVNDTLGHHAGDELIRQVADRLRLELRELDTLARLGGDEFVVLLSEVDGEVGATGVAARLIAAVAQPFAVRGHELFVSCSIGIAVAPGAGNDYETLLQHADVAMYNAKAAGGSTYSVHVRALDGSQGPDGTDRRRFELEGALRAAVANRELRVLYQPQVELSTGHIVGAEALVRWEHPTFGTIGPDVFIPMAEESGLILEIDRWVRRTALAQTRAWLDDGFGPLRISFNLSTRELRNPALPAQLSDDIAEFGVDPGLVEVEITERVVMTENEDLVSILHSLRDVGVRLAIDDFGTGSSVLGRLQRHPVDTLKIDRSFIGEISTVASAAVIKALLQMGEALGIDVVAEGVETIQQRDVLRALGCDLVQGFLFSRPVGAMELRELLVDGAVVPSVERGRVSFV